MRHTRLWYAALALAACSQHRAAVTMGVSGPRDASVAVFRADRQTSWTRFRLGGGLNVVVVSPGLPRAFAWRFASGGISSSPTVMGTTILVSANDDHLYAIDGATGSLVWKYRAENELMSQPSYAGGLIFVGTGNSDGAVYDIPYYCVTGSGMNKLEAVDARTGIEQWWSALTGSGMPSSAIVGDSVISIDGTGVVLAVDARTGAYRWDTRLLLSASMSSVVAGDFGRVYVSGNCRNAVYALRARDGSIAWEHRLNVLDGAVSDDPLASTGTALVGDYLEPIARGPYGMAVTNGATARQHVYALRMRDGRLLWDTTLASVRGVVPEYNESAIALVYGSRVYAGSAIAPVVTALDARTGRIVWQLRVDGPVKGGIAARDGILYFGDLSGMLWAVDAQNGRVIGSVATDMQFNVGSPIIVNDSLVDGGLQDVIALPLSNIRDSRPMAGITRLSVWQRIARRIVGILPHRDPHREASYH